jgi:hypothetical protein
LAFFSLNFSKDWVVRSDLNKSFQSLTNFWSYSCFASSPWYLMDKKYVVCYKNVQHNRSKSKTCWWFGLEFQSNIQIKTWKDARVSWHQYNEMHVVLYSLITSKKARPSTASITYRYWSVWTMKLRKNGRIWRKKVLFHQDNAPCHKINQNVGKFAWIRLRIASPSTVFSWSGFHWLFFCLQTSEECLLQINLVLMKR